MITPKLKDEILNYLVVNCLQLHYSGELEKFAQQFHVPSEYMEAILDQFQERDFIDYQPFIGGAFMLTLKAKAHDYMIMGGHVGEFEMLDLELKKIQSELYSLEKTLEKNKFDILTTSINTVIGFLSASYNR